MHGFRGAFYVVPSLVGLSSSWDGVRERPLADWDQLIAIASRGHELGNHSLTHPQFASLSQFDQLIEIESATKVLLARGIKVSSIAFPYGSYNRDTFTAMKTAGIQVGLALGKRPVGDDDLANCLPRIVVGFSDVVAKLLYKIYVRPKLP
jgi:peptidoglycan/xylan/chitin deacetylase (PgdA/CDA1 family)